MAITPTRILEIEFDAGIWTNVTADLVSLTTRRGRNRESGAFETGQLVFELRNDTRKYDPDHTAGTYYGKLRPNRRVRLRATYSAVTYDVFLGYIDRISQVSGGPNDATAIFQVSDLFKLLNRAEMPTSVYRAEVEEDLPELWYHLDEPVGSTTAINSGTLGRAYDATYAQIEFYSSPGMALGEAPLITHDPGTAVRAGGGAVPVPAGQLDPLTDYYLTHTGAWAVEFWGRPSAAFGGRIFMQGNAGPPGVSVGGLWQSSGRVGLYIYNDAGTGYAVESSTVQSLDTTYHVVLRKDADNTMHVIVNGADVTQNAAGSPGTTFSGTVTPPGPLNPLYLDATFSSVTTIDELAIYKSATGIALSTARAAAHNTAGRTPWNGDDPGTRLNRIISMPGMPAISAVIDAGEPALQSTDLSGSLLAYAQKVEETSLGLLFVAKNGDLTFVGRNSSVTGTYLTSQATLVDDDSGAGIPYRSADADVDEAFLVTRATVSRNGSVAVTVSDAAALVEFGPFDETHDGLLHNSDSYSQSYAEWIVNTHKAPSSRVGTVALELTKDPVAMYPAILALELGQRVTYKRKPQNVGSVISLPMRVEAISHETGKHYWRTKLQLSPFNLATSGYPVGVWDVTNWDQSVWGI